MLLSLLFFAQSRCPLIFALRECLIHNLVVYRVQNISLRINKILSVANIVESCNRKWDSVWFRNLALDFRYNCLCIIKNKPICVQLPIHLFQPSILDLFWKAGKLFLPCILREIIKILQIKCDNITVVLSSNDPHIFNRKRDYHCIDSKRIDFRYILDFIISQRHSIVWCGRSSFKVSDIHTIIGILENTIADNLLVSNGA